MEVVSDVRLLSEVSFVSVDVEFVSTAVPLVGVASSVLFSA